MKIVVIIFLLKILFNLIADVNELAESPAHVNIKDHTGTTFGQMHHVG